MKEVRQVYWSSACEMIQKFKMVKHYPVVAPLTSDIHQNCLQQGLSSRFQIRHWDVLIPG
jgi:hypothetical protein